MATKKTTKEATPTETVITDTTNVVMNEVKEVVENTEIVPISEGKKEEKKVVEIPVKDERSMEEKIIDFIESREGEIKMNDFLKSLYPVPMYNQASVALEQGNSKYIKKILEDLQAAGKLSVVNNSHRRLGEHHYEPVTGKALRHNIATIQIVVKK